MQRIADEHGPSTVVAGDLLAALARSAERRGAETAVSAPDGTFTFAELTEQVSRLAAALSGRQVGPGTPVALNCGRSRMAPAALLAVWKVGAIAVPLDARHPVDRLNFVLRDAGAELLIGDPLPAGAAPRRLVRLDPSDPEVTDVGPGAGRPGEPEDCAYLIYTSGTTGWPKAVEVSYGNLQAFWDALAELDAPVGGIGVNAVSPAFDGWLWCALLYLRFGQQLHIVDLADGEPTGLTERLAALRPRVVCLTPTLLAGCADPLPDTELIVVAGEPCPASLVERFAPGRRMLNVYGPTETTIAATWADSARGDDPRTIGRALPGYVTYLLDPAGRPVPDGEPGELYIGGRGVARGYRNQPQLTAERFLTDPFQGGASRMYRTGDRALLRPDGQLEYLGRVDEQVKVHGFRIELAGVDRIAAEAPGVRGAATFVLDGGHGLGLALVLEPGVEQAGCLEEVRRRCQRLLPEQHVPALIRTVPTLPVTTSGKLDRDALATAALGWQQPAGRPPSGQRELQVCEVFEQLLDRPVPDADADFFELGGHSLLAARAVSALRAATGLPATMRSLLANPTVGGLAAELDRLAGQPTGAAPGTPQRPVTAPAPADAAEVAR